MPSSVPTATMVMPCTVSEVTVARSTVVNTNDLSSDVADLPDDIDELRGEIDRMDALILAAIQRRSAVSKKIGAARMAAGGPRLVHSREVKVLERFSALGAEGHTLAMLLLRLGRGPLGGTGA